MKRALLIAGGTVGGLGAVLSITPPHLDVAATSVNALPSGTTNTDIPQTDASSATPVSSPATTATVSSTPTSSATQQTTSSAPAPTKASATKSSATKSSTTKSTATAVSTKNATSSTPSTSTSATQTPASQTPTPTPTKTTSTPTPAPTPVASGVSGSFTGATYDAAENNRLWGRVTVTVTLNNGEISNISAVQSPSSRGNNAFSYLTPAVLNQKLTVKAVMAITPTSLVSQIRGYTGASYSSFAYWQSLQSALSKSGL